MHEFESVLRERVAQASAALLAARGQGDIEAADVAQAALSNLLRIASTHGVDVSGALAPSTAGSEAPQRDGGC